ncbi:Argonaute family protein [Rhynchospora pubera]|uniref:Argonaute family protein n=1 Tax=Rhynchospora pubera TaxID=906938 RepID=A0AAV8DPF2_9POAL|nr:Argonaute family protein [Rhynchospora pubera]
MGEGPKLEVSKRVPMARPGVGEQGRRITLLSNHFNVRLTATDAVFYHYSVAIKYEDDKAVENKGIGRKVIEKLVQMYSSELDGKDFAYDGEKSLFTVGPLRQNIFEFQVLLEETSCRVTGKPGNESPGETGDKKRQKQLKQTKAFKVSLTYAAKIPLKSIAMSLRGTESPQTQDALRVLDIILRQQQANRGCLLVRQSFFSGDPKNFVDLGGGVTGCRGFHSSFYTTLGGLSLNMDVTTTMIMTPGPVIDFLLANQNVREPSMVDWAKAKKMLKNMRIKTKHSKMEFKIIGMSELPCNKQCFPMKVREENGESQTEDVTVCEYYQKRRQIEVSWSANFPCLDVGKPKRPNYLPLELCDLIPLQRYTKALSSQQRASLVEKSRQKPQDRAKTITESLRNSRYDEDPLLRACGIQIERQLNRFDGRILTAPTLLLGNGEESVPNRGRWNFNHKKLINPVKIERWAICNFSARVDMSHVSREIINCGRSKGIHIARPFTLVEEDRQWLRAGPVVRVDKMFEKIRAQLPGPPQFLLCILPERKNSELYGPWKRKNLHEMGIVTQCISPGKLNDQYFTNVLLKINAKLGGMNSLISMEHKQSIPIIHEIPTLILGLDVSHGSPGRSDLPSIAAVVGSRQWPSISKYRASVRTQSPKLEMIDQLYKPTADGKDDGMIREILIDFFQTSGGRKPAQIIIFRDGVSETQFSQVLNIELNQIIEAYKHLGDGPLPKITLIIAQKNHHTKLFQADSPDNVPPGTVVDTKVVHPRNYDFFMCAHNGMIGTSRPTHYHVLVDEIGFSVDDLQKLVHSLSYVYQRSTTAISVVAPICYAHLAAQQMSQFMKFEDLSDSSSGGGGIAAVPDLPRLHQNVCNSMFFC